MEGRGSKALVIFYHTTNIDAALAILKDGFIDHCGGIGGLRLSGVWISDNVLDANEGCKGNTTLRLKTEQNHRFLDRYEIIEDGKPYREWCVPARLLNSKFSADIYAPEAEGE